MRTIFFFVSFYLCFLSAFYSQQRYIDSLTNLLRSGKEDTNRVNRLNDLGRELAFSDPDTSIILGKQALVLAEKLYRSDVSKPNQKKAASRRVSSTLGNLGAYYWIKADYNNALDNYLKALKIDEDVKYKNGIARHLGNIGMVYFAQNSYEQALEYYFKFLELGIELKNKNYEATSLGNIGNAYCAQADMARVSNDLNKAAILYKKALDFYLQALEIDDQLGNKSGVARHYGNIGSVNSSMAEVSRHNNNETEAKAQLEKAVNYYLLSTKMAEELGNNNLLAIQLGNLGSVYTTQKKYKEASVYLFRALELNTKVSAFSGIKHDYEYLSSLYERSNVTLPDKINNKTLNKEDMRLRSLYYYKKFVEIRDTILSEEKKKELVRKEMNFDFQKKEAATKAEQDKKDAIAKEALKQKEQQRNYFIIGFIITAVLALYIFWGYKQKQRSNQIITSQKILVDTKQKEILDSIHYAQRIQSALLTNNSIWQKISQQHFVFFKPKDIVSGDFYWAFETPDNKSIWAAADCTGHGVPGAFMSMLGNSLLNEIVIENKIYKASEILNRLRAKIILALTKENVSQNDGMDISLCVWDRSNNMLEFSGANNHAVIIRDNTLQKIKGDKMPIGNYHGEEKSFTSNEFKLQNNDTIYLYTDGFADQFGGPKGKKFRYKQLDEHLLTNHASDMSLQAKLLEQTFLTWKGELVQTDDICIIGIKVLT